MIVVVVVIVVTLGREITANAEHAATRTILAGWPSPINDFLDVLVARRLQDAAGVAAGNDALERIVSMLVRLVQSIDEGGPRDKRSRQRQRSRGGDEDHDNDPR